MALGLVLLLAPILAVLAAHHRGRLPDRMISMISQIGIAIPNFWLAIMMIHLFALTLAGLQQVGSAPGMRGWSPG